MAADLSERVREIAEQRDLPESAVLAEALERGVAVLWKEVVLERYLDGGIDRTEAVDLVGGAAVERAERERDAVEADVEWGFQA